MLGSVKIYFIISLYTFTSKIIQFDVLLYTIIILSSSLMFNDEKYISEKHAPVKGVDR